MTDQTQRSGIGRLFDRVKDRVWADPVRRRRLLRLGIVVVVVTVFIAIPSYVATQSTFMQRYSNYEAEVETWEASVHAKVSCRTCHVEPGFVEQTKHSVQMLGEFYVSLVLRSREPALLSKPTNDACSSCHIDLRTVSPSGDLNIPHRAHVEVLEMDCITCHEFLVHELSPDGLHVPRMEACLECHDGDQAKDACSDCHTEKGAPEDHQEADWVIVHPDKQDEVDCASCHDWTEDWCADCHSRRPSSHEGKWRSNHRFTVEERRNCEACHEAEFCIRCHGEVPQLNFDPDLQLAQ